MACLLCLEDGSAVPAQRFLDIFSEEGCHMNICSIIAKHLWLKPERDITTGQRICWTCWEALRDFHIFYQRVAEVHNRSDWKTPFASIQQEEQENDPLPQEIQLKSEDAIEEKLQNPNDIESNVFDSEVKLEVYDLDLLPQVEVIEDAPPVSDRSHRVKRRGRAQKDVNGKTSAGPKRIKRETSPLPSSDSETELPLSVLMNTKSDTKDEQNSNAISSPVSATMDDTTKQHSTNSAETQKRGRGRPRKVKGDESTATRSSIKKKDKANRNDTKINIKQEEFTSIKDDDGEGDNDDVHLDFDGASADTNSETDDSSESSGDENTDSDDSLPDFEPKPKYAVIPKRKVVKPKKYRKREKPVVPPKRMTPEELEAKRAQQAEFDRVIKQFFGRFVCPKCELLVKNFADLRAHFRISHGDDQGYLMCCGRKFSQRKALAEHIYVHWNPEHFKCKTCGRIFTESRKWELHEQSHTNPPEPKERKEFPCDKCPKVFSSKAAYEHHSAAKHVPKSEYQWVCTQCNKKLPTQRKLKDHIKYNHDPECTIICDKCGKQVRTQYLRKHHHIEHPEQPRPAPQPMQCQICGTWLRHLSGLKQHMKSIHEDPVGENRCHICNKVSTTSRALRRHIYLNHECERKFKCTMCEKAFKRPQDLREHTSTHTGEVLYTCPNCPMTFFSNANMYKHRQRLHRAEWEADRKKPRHLGNIMAQAMGATAAQKVKQAVGATTAFFAQNVNTNASTITNEIVDANTGQQQIEQEQGHHQQIQLTI